MNTYSLKTGKLFSISRLPRPREGEMVFFTVDEWTYIKSMGFTDQHKLFLWEAKFRDHRYPIIPKNQLTEPEVARKYCQNILQLLSGKKAG